MNLIYGFIALIIFMGFLLIVMSIYAYTQLNEKCTSKTLRTYLQWAIGLGTTFTTIGIGYILCLRIPGCNCLSGDGERWKTYVILFSLLALGCIILPIVVGIKNELNAGGCNVNLGSLPDFLIAIASIQIALPVLYLIYIVVKGIKFPDKKPEKDTVDDESEESKSRKSSSKKEAADKIRKSILKARLDDYDSQLSEVQLKIERLGDKRADPSDLEKQELLTRSIEETKAKISNVGKSSSDSSSTQSSSILGRRFGGGGT